MRVGIRLAASFAVVVATMSLASAKDWQTVRIGTDATYPPFESLDSSGKFVGFDIEIANALCDQMKVKCEFINQDFDGIIPALLAGKFDAIVSSISITEERKKQIDFSDKIYNTPPALVARKESGIKGITKADLAGKAIGVQSSTTHANYAQQTWTDSDIKLYPSADKYELDLANGRLDAINDDIVVLSEWLKTPDGAACCELVGEIKIVPAIHGIGTGVGLRKEDSDLRDLFNKAIAAIRADGKFKTINDKYFTFDAYGG